MPFIQNEWLKEHDEVLLKNLKEGSFYLWDLAKEVGFAPITVRNHLDDMSKGLNLKCRGLFSKKDNPFVKVTKVGEDAPKGKGYYERDINKAKKKAENTVEYMARCKTKTGELVWLTVKTPSIEALTDKEGNLSKKYVPKGIAEIISLHDPKERMVKRNTGKVRGISPISGMSKANKSLRPYRVE